jgi:hypothetical protein
MACQSCEERRQIMQGWTSDFAEWVKRPFREDMSVFGWFAFLGLMIAILAAYGWLLARLK